MSEPDLPATATAHPRRSGARLFLTALVTIAALCIVAYLLRVPAQKELARLRGLGPAEPTMSSTEPQRDRAGSENTPQDPRVAELNAQLEQLRGRVETLEQRMNELAASPSESPNGAPPITNSDPLLAAVGARIDALGARQDRTDAQLTVMAADLKADAARLEAAANQAAAVADLTDRTARLAHVQQADAALRAGQKINAWPNQPAALARFQSIAPPTEAALRRSFEDVASKARAAARPDTEGQGFWRSMLARAGALITVRRGDEVLVGSHDVGVIDRARTALQNGDLQGAVSTLSGLSGRPANVFAGWRADAQALLDARAAIVKLANQS